MSSKTDAYLKGYDQACQGGDFEDHNPYRSDNSGLLWVAWRQGFSDALQNKPPQKKQSKWKVGDLI